MVHDIRILKYNHTGSAVNSTTTNTGTPNQFKYHFFCTGKEKEITDCSLSDREVSSNLCNGNMVATLLCDTGDTKLHIIMYCVLYTLVAIITFLLQGQSHLLRSSHSELSAAVQ